MIKSMENLSYEERVKGMGLFTTERRYVKVMNGEDRLGTSTNPFSSYKN